MMYAKADAKASSRVAPQDIFPVPAFPGQDFFISKGDVKMKKLIALLLSVLLVIPFVGCGEKKGEDYDYTLGLCNYVDDASLNQIADSIKARLSELAEKNGKKINVIYDNCNGDANVLSQIISNFKSKKVDVMAGIATPVAMAMQGATEDEKMPIVFAAISDPVGTGLADSFEKPGHNLTGTSDFLDTNTILKLMLLTNPDIKKVGLLYDIGQDNSTLSINDAKKFLSDKGIEVVERTGTNVSEIVLAAEALVADKVDAVFTPTDNTVMNAELSIYETFLNAKIPHFAGADSFALNGAFLGYGVDYENLGFETAEMIYEILSGKKPADTPIKTFDNGTATINEETAAALGYDYDKLAEIFAPNCTKVQKIKTAHYFGDK